VLDADGPERADAGVFWLWPESLDLWLAWHQVQTQWVWVGGMAGAVRTGLDYARVTAWLQGNGWRKGRQRNLRTALQALQACEHAALKAWESLRLRNPQQSPTPRR
jgi:hypothetical protein